MYSKEKCEKERYPLILMCTYEVAKKLEERIPFFRRFIEPSRIVVIGNEKVGEFISEKQIEVEFQNEDEILEGLSYQKIENILIGIYGADEIKRRTGWYFQQFLKLAYSFISDSSCYLAWDADTLPVDYVHMLQGERKVFHVIKNHHEPYFKTFKKLFPGYIVENEQSYIVEHMLFDRRIVKKMLEDIEGNDEIKGDSFYEKILNSIDNRTDLLGSGFSEFETYGNYVNNIFPNEYIKCTWRNLRVGTAFFGKGFTEEDQKWLKGKVNVVSFEKHKKHINASRFFSVPYVNKIFVMIYLALIDRN